MNKAWQLFGSGFSSWMELEQALSLVFPEYREELLGLEGVEYERELTRLGREFELLLDHPMREDAAITDGGLDFSEEACWQRLNNFDEWED